MANNSLRTIFYLINSALISSNTSFSLFYTWYGMKNHIKLLLEIEFITSMHTKSEIKANFVKWSKQIHIRLAYLVWKIVGSLTQGEHLRKSGNGIRNWMGKVKNLTWLLNLELLGSVRGHMESDVLHKKMKIHIHGLLMTSRTTVCMSMFLPFCSDDLPHGLKVTGVLLEMIWVNSHSMSHECLDANVSLKNFNSFTWSFYIGM